MSLQFNNTTTKSGIIQLIERNCGFADGQVSGNPTLLKQFTSEVNVTVDDAHSIIFQADGTWQFDGTDQTDWPVIKRSLVAGQRDYSFTEDETGNLILDVERVFVLPSSTATLYQEIFPVDVQSGPVEGIGQENTVQGTPYSYDKTGNGIFLDPVPSYTLANGLKVYISREGLYFTTTDTTRKPGFAGLFHEFLALGPSYRYARSKGLKNVNLLKRDLDEMEQSIVEYYSKREKDVSTVLTPEPINYL